MSSKLVDLVEQVEAGTNELDRMVDDLLPRFQAAVQKGHPSRSGRPRPHRSPGRSRPPPHARRSDGLLPVTIRCAVERSWACS